MLYESIYMKCPEKANLYRQKADYQLPGIRSGLGLTVNGAEGSYWACGNVLKLMCSDGYRTW